MPGEIIGRYALPDLHGSKPGHRLVSLRTRRRLFGLCPSLRALPIMPRRHRLLPHDIPADRADAHRQTQSKAIVRDNRARIQQAGYGGDKRANFGRRSAGEQHLRTPDGQTQSRRVREISQNCYLSYRKSVLKHARVKALFYLSSNPVDQNVFRRV